MQHTILNAAMLPIAITALLLSHSTLKASETDDRIEAAAGSSYVFRTFLKDDVIKTTSKDGVVTLTGNVTDSSHKNLAEHTVALLPGVKSVDNQIKTEDGPAENSDTWLYLKVKSTLAYHRSVSAFNTQIEIKEGIVTLKGEASSQAQKDLVTEYTQDVIGIKGVKNEMHITNPGKSIGPATAEMIDDASITAQVLMALITHRSTSILTTSVTTKEGVVTVTGKANNQAEIDLVTKFVTDINGVTKVDNNMTLPVAQAN